MELIEIIVDNYNNILGIIYWSALSNQFIAVEKRSSMGFEKKETALQWLAFTIRPDRVLDAGDKLIPREITKMIFNRQEV